MEKTQLAIKNETHGRSIVKSILWRIIGVGVLALITWLVTHSLIQTSFITFLHHFVFIFVFYLHERLWMAKKFSGFTGKTRKFLRMFVYEIILGQGILALICLIVTGSVQQMTIITWFYIGNKLWIYVLYDEIWNKIRWNKQ